MAARTLAMALCLFSTRAFPLQSSRFGVSSDVHEVFTVRSKMKAIIMCSSCVLLFIQCVIVWSPPTRHHSGSRMGGHVMFVGVRPKECSRYS